MQMHLPTFLGSGLCGLFFGMPDAPKKANYLRTCYVLSISNSFHLGVRRGDQNRHVSSQCAARDSQTFDTNSEIARLSQVSSFG